MEEDFLELTEKIYSEDLNYKIECTNKNGSKECCAVYFSSNGLFFPNNVETLSKIILDKDRYELTRMKIGKANKHIFLRDIHKLWYADGINANISDIDKIVELLKKETKGYKHLIISGISGGGYAAVIAGVKLKADLIFCIDGQWNLELDHTQVLHDKHKEGHPSLNKYWNIARSEFNYDNIFYFVSDKNEDDVRQLTLVQKLDKVHIIRIATSHHGVPFLKSTLPVILNMNREALLKLCKKRHYPLLFDFKIAGLSTTLKCLYKEIRKRII